MQNSLIPGKHLGMLASGGLVIPHCSPAPSHGIILCIIPLLGFLFCQLPRTSYFAGSNLLFCKLKEYICRISLTEKFLKDPAAESPELGIQTMLKHLEVLWKVQGNIPAALPT